MTGPDVLPVPVGANVIRCPSPEYVLSSPLLPEGRAANPTLRAETPRRPRISCKDISSPLYRTFSFSSLFSTSAQATASGMYIGANITAPMTIGIAAIATKGAAMMNPSGFFI